MKSILLSMLLLSCMLTTKAQLTVLSENFTACSGSAPAGWTAYNVSGTEVWTCTSSGFSGNGIQISGYNGGSNYANEDWLITPVCDFNAMHHPVLSFQSHTNYTGQALDVFVSTNYTSSTSPATATWIPLTPSLPYASSNTWYLSDGTDLTPYKNQPLHIAFRYQSTNTAASTWKLDDIQVKEEPLLLDRHFLQTGSTTAGSTSAIIQTNLLCPYINTNLQVFAPSPFELSTDGINFSSLISYNASCSGNTQLLYVRFHPAYADKVYRRQAGFILDGDTLGTALYLMGSSIPASQTLNVFNWNMRWFGNASSCVCDTALALTQAITMMKGIAADLYCVEEIVDVNKVESIRAALGSSYQAVVSPFCSLAVNPSSGNYASGQKLAFLYNTDKIQSLGTFGLLASTYPADTSSNSAYYCFSSGRFPFVLKAKVNLPGGLSDTLIVVNLHAKALSDMTSYNRRVCEAEKMTDSLLALFPGKKILIAGDYNDFLEGTDVSGLSLSPYSYLLNHGFEGITLPSHYAGQSTYVPYANSIIDNIVVSPLMMSRYIDSSCFIWTEPDAFIPNYVSTTSDHYPVVSYYRFDAPEQLTSLTTKKGDNIFAFNNPSSNVLTLHLLDEDTELLDLVIRNMFGQVLYHLHAPCSSATPLSIQLPDMVPGLYWLDARQGDKRQIAEWIVTNE